MSTKPPNAFTIGYGQGPIKFSNMVRKTKPGLAVSPRGVAPVLRPSETAARKLALKSKL